ncbi:lysozyme inhibitor LprI family protein [Cypionkella sp.]|uniref:lysozyme inhibitor LprI family protein n=1 Tax=Cypionkella sp. TaxID=2811411 RepID=UPI002AB9F97C|nr:lysozyme inhibitor LprI family protein [Cypionkella sp.]MDZ4393600.1 lysozyme inhibitor LprI family protein [Cypionkella sp.]
MRLVLLGCFWALTALPALAQEVDCANAEMQMELTYCAEQDWLAADADLNAAYGVARKLMQGIDAELEASQRGAADFLREGQRAWVTFRDATCAAEGYAMHGGSAEPMVIYGCRARLTEQRTADLEAMAEEY